MVNGFAYLIGEINSPRFSVVDVSIPSAPVFIGSVETHNTSATLCAAGDNVAVSNAFGLFMYPPQCAATQGIPDQLAPLMTRLSVDPNPVRSIATFKVEGAGRDQLLEIYSADGRLKDVLKVVAGKAHWSAAPDLPRGMYFARIAGDHGARPIKFVVIR